MDSLGLYDIYDYWCVPFWQTTFFNGAFILLIIVMFVLCTVFVVKRVKKKKSADMWVSWHATLNTLKKNQMSNQRFYDMITHMLKEVAVIKLGASSGCTDTELGLFFKNEQFSHEIQALGVIIDRAVLYKFDPIQEQSIECSKSTDVESIAEALIIIKKQLTST